MLTIPFQDFIIMIFLIIAFFILGLILGMIRNPRLKKNKGNGTDAANSLIENGQELDNTTKDYRKSDNKKTGSADNIDQRNEPYKRYSRNGYYNR